MDIFLPPSNKLVLTLVAVVILSSVIIALLCRCVSRSKSRLKRVLIAGPCGAGKTRLVRWLTGECVGGMTLTAVWFVFCSVAQTLYRARCAYGNEHGSILPSLGG